MSRSIWMLGFVSLFMDMSSEMIHGLLPVFLVTVIGASTFTVGLIEGLGEGVSAFLKLVSGTWSDRLGKRKPLAVAGYGLAALSKPLFPLADSALTVLAARVFDRVGKGIRGAPRDALVADLTPPELHGAAFGLRQSLDTVGAFVGPLLAIALMEVLGGDMRKVFAFAVIPALLSVTLLVFGVPEPAQPLASGKPRPRLNRESLQRLPRPFWLLMAVAAPFLLARFSEAFLILRAQSQGLANALAPAVLVVMNLTYAATAYPAGKLSDRVPRTRLLTWGCAVLLAANLCLAAGDTLAWTAAGTVLWGLHMGLTEGLVAALVADHAPADLRGTAFGVLNFVRAVLLLAASALAGALWTGFGPGATFGAGALLSMATMVVLLRLPGPAMMAR